MLEEQKAAVEDDLKVERGRHQTELAQIREEVNQREQVIEGLRTRLLLIVAEAVCKTRAELFKEYLSGAHSNWNPQEMKDEVDTYEEMQRLDLEESQEGVNDEVDADQTLVENAPTDIEEDAAAGVVPAPKDVP